ncbi:MAG TPA: nuclear transport factor 2 family protein [Thermoanaerobaculia bacterium]
MDPGPRVQASGDVAVLTFNYVSRGSNEATTRWNCTEVYRLVNGAWRIIQTHWSFTKAPGASPAGCMVAGRSGKWTPARGNG